MRFWRCRYRLAATCRCYPLRFRVWRMRRGCRGRASSTSNGHTSERTRRFTLTRALRRSATFTGFPYRRGGAMSLTRRELLLGLAARAVAAPVLDWGFGRVTRIAEGVYATIADPGKGMQ